MNNSETLHDVAQRIREHADTFITVTHDSLFSRYPQARPMFPHRDGQLHAELIQSVVTILDQTPLSGRVPTHLLRQLGSQAAAHRRYGFPADAYDLLAAGMERALEIIAGDLRNISTAQRALRSIAQRMKTEQERLEISGIPPAYVAEVVDVERRSRRISVVRVETPVPIEFEPGQHIAMTTDFLGGKWLHFSPALPSNSYGQLEFHIRHIERSSASLMFAKPRIGDRWTLAAPQGCVTLSSILGGSSTNPDLLLVGCGTGFGPLKAMILSLFERAASDSSFTPPKVHLVVATDFPGELYDIVSVANLAQLCDWLTVGGVVKEEKTPPLVGGVTEIPSNIPLTVTQELGDYLVEEAPWQDRSILVMGPGADVLPAVNRLYRTVPINSVTYEAW